MRARAEDPLKKDECRMAGRYMLEMLKSDLKPLDIMTYKVRCGTREPDGGGTLL